MAKCKTPQSFPTFSSTTTMLSAAAFHLSESPLPTVAVDVAALKAAQAVSQRIAPSPPLSAWSDAVMECMARMMREAASDEDPSASQTSASAAFFRKLSPFLGPQVRDHNGRPVQIFPSFMCDDGTPVEFGVGIKDDRFHFRLSIEAIDNAASRSRANIHSGLVLVDQLAKLDLVDLTLFRRFAKHFLCDRVSLQDLQRCQSSQLFFGFDSAPSTRDSASSQISVKSYFIPELHCAQHGIDAMTSLDNLLRSLGGPWATSRPWTRLLAHYRNSHAAQSTTPTLESVAPLKPVIVSVDCKNPSDARIKVYFRFNTFEIEQAAWHLSCGDETQLPRYRRDLEHLWRTLLNIPASEDVQQGILGRYAPSEVKMKCAATQGLLIYHEFSASAPKSTSKVYIPIRHFKRTDNEIMKAVVSLDREQVDGPRSESSTQPLSEAALYEKMQRVVNVGLPHLDHAKSSCHNYVTAAFKSGNRVEYSSYINPRVFSSIEKHL